MSKPIELHFKWSSELALQTSKLYYDYDMRHSNKRYLGWFFVALVQFGIVGALKHNSYGLLYLSTFLVGYWYYGRWMLRKRVLLHFYKKKIPKSMEMHFRIDAQGLNADDASISWEDVNRIIPFDEGFLIQSNENVLFFKYASFDSKEAKARFIKLAKTKGKM